jgi:acetolactate synthase-1/2/3 large subunit
MGFGLPGAIGASFGLCDKNKEISKNARVILIAGDGGFQMTLQELGILCECPVPVKIIIMNNRALGMVDNMEIGKGGKYLLGDTPDFSLLAKAYNVPAQRTGLSSETADLVEAFLADGESGLLEIIF